MSHSLTWQRQCPKDCHSRNSKKVAAQSQSLPRVICHGTNPLSLQRSQEPQQREGQALSICQRWARIQLSAEKSLRSPHRVLTNQTGSMSSSWRKSLVDTRARCLASLPSTIQVQAVHALSNAWPIASCWRWQAVTTIVSWDASLRNWKMLRSASWSQRRFSVVYRKLLFDARWT